MRVLVDCLTRVSSSRAHNKYRDHFIYALDQQGKKTPVFGSDGRAIFFEDTTLLNYRKKKVWDPMLEEVVSLTDNFGVSGLHLGKNLFGYFFIFQTIFLFVLHNRQWTSLATNLQTRQRRDVQKGYRWKCSLY